MKRPNLFWSLMLTLALIPACAIARQSRTAIPTPRALLIACGEHSSPDIPKLLAPRSDVRLMTALLTEQYQFSPPNIALVGMRQGELGPGYNYQNTRATSAAIRLAFEQLAQKAGPEDPVIIYISGHGARRADARAATLNTEWLVTYDLGIPDRQLKEWIKRLRSRHITAIFDTCYSGGFTAQGGGVSQKDGGLRYERVSKALPPDVTIPMQLIPEPADSFPAPGARRGPKAMTKNEYTLLTACTEEQETQEIRQIRNNRCVWAISGFTWALYHTLINRSPVRSLDELQKQVKTQLQQAGCIQTPVFKPYPKHPNPFAALPKARNRLPAFLLYRTTTEEVVLKKSK